jgi:ribonuclease HI
MMKCQRRFCVHHEVSFAQEAGSANGNSKGNYATVCTDRTTSAQHIQRCGIPPASVESAKSLDGVKFLKHVKAQMSDFVAYVDGGSWGNPGPSGIGVIIDTSDGDHIRIAKSIGRQDNNVAEYVALMEALQCALARKARSLHVYSDSDVVVRQMSGEYKCSSPRLYSLNWICRKLAGGLKFSIRRIPREHNFEANHLAREGCVGARVEVGCSGFQS